MEAEAILNLAPGAEVVLDAKGKIVQWNPNNIEGHPAQPSATQISAEITRLTGLILLQGAKQNGEAYLLNGEDYRVPFMKDDADGVMQVKAAFDLGLTDTVIHFTNGTKMPITATEFRDFVVWFVTKRNSFFMV